MKKLLVTSMILSTLLFTGCNIKITSPSEKMTKATILFNGDIIEVDIDKWSSSNGTFYLYDKDGKVYITSAINVLITNK